MIQRGLSLRAVTKPDFMRTLVQVAAQDLPHHPSARDEVACDAVRTEAADAPPFVVGQRFFEF